MQPAIFQQASFDGQHFQLLIGIFLILPSGNVRTDTDNGRNISAYFLKSDIFNTKLQRLYQRLSAGVGIIAFHPLLCQRFDYAVKICYDKVQFPFAALL